MSVVSSLAGRRASVVAILAALGVAAVGCGDSDDGDSSASTASDKAAAGDISYEATLEGSDREQIETTMRYLRIQFNTGKGEAFCAKLTPSGVGEVLRYGKLTGTPGRCAAIIGQASKDVLRGTPTGQRPVYVSTVDVNGEKAVIRMRGGLIGTRVAPLRLRNVDGEWKLIEVGTKKKYGA